MLFNHLSVGASVSTSGIGLELATPIGRFFTIHAGADYMPSFSIKSHINYDRPAVLNNVPSWFLEERYVNIPETGANVEVVGKPNLTQGKVLFDFNAASTGAGFRLTAGVYFGNKILARAKAVDKTIAAVELYNKDIADGTVQAEPSHPDGITVDLEGYPMTLDRGRTALELSVNKVRPYIGIGWGRAMPRKRLSFNFDLGVLYIGSPKVIDKYGGNEISKDDPRITQKLSDAIGLINGIPVYPMLKFTLFGRIF